MTLADPRVQDLLQRDFVAVWGNSEGDATAGASFAHAPDSRPGTCIRGNGEHNIQILVATAAGELLAVTAGFVSAADLVDQLERMRDLHRSLGRTADGDERQRLVRAAHEGISTELQTRKFAGPLGDWERRRALEDHRYSARCALQPIATFRPADLVGEAQTFFGSSTGTPPTGRIGDGPEAAREPPLPKPAPPAAKPTTRPDGVRSGGRRAP